MEESDFLDQIGEEKIYGLAIFYHGYMFLIFSTVSKFTKSINEVNNTFNWFTWQQLAGLIGSVLCIVGAVIMWKRKKMGFYIYLLGQGVPVLLSFYISLIIANKLGSQTLFFSILPNVIPIGFVIMYAIQLKDMKR
jgi:hypothetical protein